MTSIKSKMIIGMVRNRHLFQFKLKREVVDETFDIQGFRDSVDKASERANIKMPEGVVKPVDIHGIYGEWIETEGLPEDKVMLYIHGGGFISGSCHTHRTHVLKFVESAGIKGLVFDYRLAPEHKYPAALDDCVQVYKWLLDEGYKPKNIVIVGESAGGTFTLTTLLKLKALNIPLPNAAVSISPVTDLRCEADAFKRNLYKDISTINAWHVWQGHYIGEADITDPFISPLFGNLTGLPPIYFCVGSYEVHYDDVYAMHEALIKAGVKSEVHEYDKMVHAFPLMAPMFKEATQALMDIAKFIKDSLI